MKRRKTIYGLLGSLVLLSTNVAAQNEAAGTLTVDGETVEIKYGYADVYEGDVTVILTDSEVPREAIPDRTYGLGANGDFKGIVFSVSAETQELQTGGWHDLTNVVHFHPITNEQGEIGNPTLTTTRFDAEWLEGAITTGGPTDVSGHQVSYEASFSLSLKREPLEVTITGVSDDPSKAYEGWCRALMAGDFEAMKSYVTTEVAEMMAVADSAEIAEGLEFQQMMMPTNIEIVSSTVDDGEATLELKGTRAMEVSTGTVQMVHEDGRWTVGEQSWSSE